MYTVKKQQKDTQFYLFLEITFHNYKKRIR